MQDHRSDVQPAARIIEAVLFIGGQAMPAAAFSEALPGVDGKNFERAVEMLNGRYASQSRPYRIEPHGDGWRIRLESRYAEWARERLRPDRGVRLGRPALETLAAVAYRQPITRAAIEGLTNVDAGPALRRLLRMRLVEQASVGVGEPPQFRTTERFLHAFRLTSLDDLPVVGEL